MPSSIKQFIVARSPKGRYRDAYCTFMAIVQAETKAGAVRAAMLLPEFSGKDMHNHGTPVAEELHLNHTYRF